MTFFGIRSAPLPQFALICACALPALRLSAQPAETPSADVSKKQAAAYDLEKRLPTPKAERSLSYTLSTARQERLEKYIPHSLRKLTQREAFHVLALGDPEIEVRSVGDTVAKPDQSFPVVFGSELANEFFYTGGIRVVGDSSDATVHERARLGPQVAVRVLTRPNGSILDARQILATKGRQSRVDLVVLCYGLEDARMGTDPASFRRAVEETIDAARALKLDVILCSPMPTVGATPEATIASARPYADVLRRIGQEEGVLYADLGDLNDFVRAEGTDGPESDHYFDTLMKTFRSQFHQVSDSVFVPRPSLHARLGSLLFQRLMDALPAATWEISKATLNPTSKEAMVLRYEISNKTQKPLELTVLPLVAAGWKPTNATPRWTLAAGEHKQIEQTYALRDARYALPTQDPYLVLPVLVSSAATTKLEEISASIQPVAIKWGLETFFNQEGSFSPSCLLVNTGTKAVKGTWEASLLGKTLKGDFEAKADANTALDLTFELPKALENRVNAPLVLKVKGGETELVSTRQVEFTRNLGLNQPRALFTTDELAPKNATVNLRVEADSGKLFLVCELTGMDLADDPKVTPAWQMEVNLDARSYGKRQTRGSTASLVASGSAGDGAGVVLPAEPWSFGDEYGAVFDPKEFKATVSSSGDSKTRKITLAIPRTYLYLHEWAMGNGNSQFGLNVRLNLLQFADASGSAPRFISYSLVDSSKHPDDAESLMVLELTDKPTQRATVNLH